MVLQLGCRNKVFLLSSCAIYELGTRKAAQGLWQSNEYKNKTRNQNFIVPSSPVSLLKFPASLSISFSFSQPVSLSSASTRILPAGSLMERKPFSYQAVGSEAFRKTKACAAFSSSGSALELSLSAPLGRSGRSLGYGFAADSVWKSGPVRFLALKGLGPRPRPVFQISNCWKTGPNQYGPVLVSLCGYKTSLGPV